MTREEIKTTEAEEKEEYEFPIDIRDVHKSYGKKHVLKGLNLQVRKGEVFGFIGKNGAGKSTTIDCVVGLKRQDSGTIGICGYNTKTHPLFAKSTFGYVSSEPVAYEMMTGNEYLQFVASSYDMIQSSFDSNYEFLRKKFELSDDDMNRRIREYSHGMKQKVCLMASLIHNPDVWILDEPTVGLDIMVYEVLVKMLREYANNGKTVFVTSHNMDLVAKICDRVAIINDGVVSDLIDFNKEPLKRKYLSKIFFDTYVKEGQ